MEESNVKKLEDMTVGDFVLVNNEGRKEIFLVLESHEPFDPIFFLQSLDGRTNWFGSRKHSSITDLIQEVIEWNEKDQNGVVFKLLSKDDFEFELNIRLKGAK